MIFNKCLLGSRNVVSGTFRRKTPPLSTVLKSFPLRYCLSDCLCVTYSKLCCILSVVAEIKSMVNAALIINIGTTVWTAKSSGHVSIAFLTKNLDSHIRAVDNVKGTAYLAAVNMISYI